MKNIRGYNYQKQKRSQDYKFPRLSEKDEYIFKTHMGMYSILRNPKNESVYMGEQACQNLRVKTYKAVLELYQRYGSPSYSDLWNYNIAAINDCGLNYFTTIPKIAPIAHLIECIPRMVYTKDKTKEPKLYVSFAIDRNLLFKYSKSVRESKETGCPVKIPTLKPEIKKTREEVIFGTNTIRLCKKKDVTIPRNSIYNRFKRWCEIYDVDESEGLQMALKSLFEVYSIDGLNDTEYYNVVTELDRMIFSKKKGQIKEDVLVKFSGKIYNLAMDIIQRYNRDPKNIEKGHMDFDTYANNALHLLNSNMPKEYRGITDNGID